MEFLSKSIEETAQIAKNFANSLSPEDDHQGAVVVGLYGELGSGKTTFMKYLAESLGVKETIQSPTFVIMKSFPLSYTRRGARGEVERLIHIDAYRLEKSAEMLNLGWREIVADPQNLVCVEWPLKIADILPPHLKIIFEHGDKENERKISIA